MARSEAPKSKHPLQLSVSQIETFRLCPRKWAWQKLDGLDDLGNESAQLGQRVHDVAERYFKNGEPLDMSTREAKILMPGLAYLPPPKYPGMDVEKWFTVEIGPALFRGLKDLQIRKGWPIGGLRPWISDHKTTTSFEWAKTEEDLLVNVQSGVYSYDLYVEEGFKEFDLQWTYLKTSGAFQAKPTKTVMTYDPMMRIVESVEETAREIEQIKKTCSTALEVPYKASGCAAFGGCRFVGNCNLSAKEELRSIMNQQATQSSLLTRLKERKAAKSTTEEASEPAVVVKEAAPVAVEKSATTAPKSSGGGSIAARLAKQKAQKEDTAAQTEAFVASGVPDDEAPVAINPPESAVAPSDEEVAARTEEKKARGKKAATVATPAGSQALAAAITVLVESILEDFATRVANKLKEK